jgi:lipopolysaccharide/colanic/teichoic acid biosynthesis glycosyltransferase
MSYATLKRLMDVVLAGVALVLFAPLMVVIALAVRCWLGRGVLFRQVRPGLHGRPFTILKFRTMTDERDGAGNLLPDERRLTPFGRFLRSTSLDELPELVNVLRGEMSLVGPRPLLLRYLAAYTERERTRMDVRPGLTGWAQVNGRNNLGWDERLALDAWYVEHCSLGLDLKVLALTPWKVLRREHVTAAPGRQVGLLDVERGHTAPAPDVAHVS